MNAYQKISCLLLIGMALWLGGKALANWMQRRDEKWAARNPAPDSDERQQEISAEHCAKVERKRAEQLALTETLRASKLS